MRTVAAALLVACTACSAPSAPPAGAPLAAQLWERDAYTSTHEITGDGRTLGWLIEYQPIPAGVTLERALPTGSYRILGRDFEDVGYITPRGDVRRYVADGSTSLGNHDRDAGLAKFFGVGRVALAPLAPSAPKAPAAAAPAEEAAAEAADEGGSADESAEESGG